MEGWGLGFTGSWSWVHWWGYFSPHTYQELGCTELKPYNFWSSLMDRLSFPKSRIRMNLLPATCDSDDSRFVSFCFIYLNIDTYRDLERVLKRAEMINGINPLNYKKKKKLQERKMYCLVKHQLSKGIIVSSTWKVKIICHPLYANLQLLAHY